jgi:sterol 24-C-methyltransferase
MAPTALEQENLSRDADFNKAMHGKSAKSRGGFAAMSGKDTAAQKAAVDEYFKHWDNKGHEEETAETREVSAQFFPFRVLRIYESC